MIGFNALICQAFWSGNWLPKFCRSFKVNGTQWHAKFAGMTSEWRQTVQCSSSD